MACIAFLSTETLHAAVGPRTIVYNLSDLQVQEDGALRLAECPCKNRGRNYATASHCPCGPECNCPADCGCRFGGPCTHHQMQPQGTPSNRGYGEPMGYGYESMGYGEPMGYGYESMGGRQPMMGYGYGGESMGYGYDCEPMGNGCQQYPCNMMGSNCDYGMPQAGYCYAPVPCELDPPCCDDEEMFCCAPEPVCVNRNNRRMNRRGCCCQPVCCQPACQPVGVVCGVRPYDETWAGWHVYSLFNNVHDCCGTVPASSYHYFPHFTRRQWNTITCHCDYYIKHLRVGYSH